jgi:mevalonate kinase
MSKGTNLAQKLYKAKVPGSLMLMGEHAVLQAKPALVAAINRYIHVTLKPRTDRAVHIVSNLGKLETHLDIENLGIETRNSETDTQNLETRQSFKFVLAAIQHCLAGLSLGFDLNIESEFSEKIGFGSSAAVVVATIRVLNKFLASNADDQQIFQQAKAVVLKVQGLGSGADVAASVFGGVIYFHSLYNPHDSSSFHNHPVNIETIIQTKKLQHLQTNLDFPTIYAMYSGNKVPTPKVIALVQQQQEKHPALYNQIFDAMAVCTEQARVALMEQDWIHFGQLMNIHHGLQSALGLSNTRLESLVYHLRNSSGIVGAKISGAGLGDCVIGIGVCDVDAFDVSDAIDADVANYSDRIALQLGFGEGG